MHECSPAAIGLSVLQLRRCDTATTHATDAKRVWACQQRSTGGEPAEASGWWMTSNTPIGRASRPSSASWRHQRFDGLPSLGSELYAPRCRGPCARLCALEREEGSRITTRLRMRLRSSIPSGRHAVAAVPVARFDSFAAEAASRRSSFLFPLVSDVQSALVLIHERMSSTTSR